MPGARPPLAPADAATLKLEASNIADMDIRTTARTIKMR
jgi:hypothetical protein